MYIIEYEKGVYASDGQGDPARTLVKYYAKQFRSKKDALKFMSHALIKVNSFRKFTNPKVLTV